MEEVSLCNWRWCPGSLGGCCSESFVAADIELPNGFVFDCAMASVWGSLARDCAGAAVDGSGDETLAGCSCWDRRSIASLLCSSSSSFRVRRACQFQ